MIKKSRNVKLDIVKFLGIVAVVMGHCGVFVDIVYQFHIPLFMFVSGMLHSGKGTIQQFPKFLIKKIKGIYLKFILLQSVFLLLHNFFVDIHFIDAEIYTLTTFIKKLISIFTLGDGESLLGALWFLISLFELTIIFECINIVNSKFKEKKIIKLILIIIVFMLILIGWSVPLPRMLNRTLILLPYYVMGYILKNKCENKTKHKYVVMIICMTIVVICSLISISWADSKIIPITYISGMCGIFACYCIADVINSIPVKFVNKTLVFIGEHSIYIMTLHFIAFKLVTFIQILLYDKEVTLLSEFPCYLIWTPWNLAYLFIGTAIPILIAYVIKNIRINIGK